MEALLQQHRESGMNDLAFIIINSHESLSQEMIEEVKSRVSLPVYQDTVDDDIWGLLKGGKDDMFIYDRCGRLTFYIPFPLSIIHPHQPIVSSAVQATYYENLCGEMCAITELDNVIPSDYQKALDHQRLRDNNANTIHTSGVKDVKILLNEEKGIVNDSSVVVDDVEDEFPFQWYNGTNADNETDLIQNVTGYLDTFNETATFSDLNDTEVRDANELKHNTSDFKEILNDTLTGVSENTVEEESFSPNNSSEDKLHSVSSPKKQVDTVPTLNARCNDPSHEQLCTEWGKKKLWHAYSCCNSENKELSRFRGRGRCGHYRQKKCKKLQPIFKCCLGTVEAPTEPSVDVGRTTGQDHSATVG